MMRPGRITLCAMALALAYSVGTSPVPRSNILSAYATTRSVGQDGRETGAKNSPHRYRRSSRWIACGFIEYPGYDGRIDAEGDVWKCDDGAAVHVVKEGYTSSRAADAKRLTRLEAKDMAAKPWRIAQTELLNEATIVELAEPVLYRGASSKWVIIWVRDTSLFLIYGPDREHVMGVYQTRYGGDVKK